MPLFDRSNSMAEIKGQMLSPAVTNVEPHDEESGLKRSAAGITLSPELFEKLLAAKNPHAVGPSVGFANPMALGFIGFVIATLSFSVVLMGWGGASGFSPIVGIFFFVGPVLLLFSMIFSWAMGLFFPMCLMGMFAVFWLSFGLLQLPSLGLGSPYATAADPTGMSSPQFNTVIALYLTIWGFVVFIFFIFSCIMTVVFATMLLVATVAMFVLSGAYWKAAAGDFDAMQQLSKAGGALLFVVSLLGLYGLFHLVALEIRFPVQLPMGDLSQVWPKKPKIEADKTESHRD